MPAVITLGEMLIDFVPTVSGVTLIEAPAFKKAAGGAPANVAVGLARLGVPSGFMGKVGDDAFGHFLAETLAENGVDTKAICFSQAARTALAFVSLKSDGERDFMFYRNPSADMLYMPEEVDEQYISQAQIFHFGSISLIGEPSRSATLRAIEVAQQSDLLVSYDPNLRLNLWPDREAAKEGLLLGWKQAGVIKASEEELAFLSGSNDLSLGMDLLWHENIRLLVVTRGRMGCAYRTRQSRGQVATFAVDPVDTTGAGDGFVAGLLKGIYAHPEDWDSAEVIESICHFANATGALTTIKRGAIPALPTEKQVQDFIRKMDQSRR